MSTNPILVYTDVKKRFDAAQKALADVARGASDKATALIRDWRKVTAPGIALIPATMGPSMLNFDKNTWPNGDRIVALLKECHESFNALENAYRALPPDDRSALCPYGPPKP